MIGLGFKIGVVAFTACVTFAALTIILFVVLGAFGRDYQRRKKENESSKVTKMPRKEK